MIRRIVLFALVGLLALTVLGCAKKVVTRISTEEVVDLSGRWNDTDSRLVSEEMIRDALSDTWLTDYMTTYGKNPTVIVGAIKNLSGEHIATGTFVGDIEREFVNSRKVEVVASREEREGIRDEREDQQANASIETLKDFGREHGADYMLIGKINAIEDVEKKEKIVFYQVDLTLTDIETNEKVWLGQKKIKKYVARARYTY